MRVGHNPARFVEKVAQPADITVTVVNCIPFLSGYYAQSLDVLKTVVDSLHSTREPVHPYDVMVFDNHSCAEVRAYLKGAADQGKIQYLILSDTNIGKIGAWNYMFGAAQGEVVVFSDGDVSFRPGWLAASLDLFNAFPNVGMVTARPLRTPMQYSTSTLDWAQSQPGVLEEGCLLEWETFWEHTRSIGQPQEQARADYENGLDYCLTYAGKKAFIGATHFQFMAQSKVLKAIIPLPSEQPMRGERALDVAINRMGLLRLTTATPLVCHLGNTLPGGQPAIASRPKRKSLLHRFLWLPLIRRFLLWLNNRIFRLYFFNAE